MDLKRLFFAGLCCLVAVGVQAQWEWTDKDGRRVFSDRAPSADVPDKNILKRPAAPVRPALPLRPAPPIGATEGDQTVAAAPGAPAASAVAPASRPVAVGQKPGPAAGTDRELQEKKRKADEAMASAKKAQEDTVAKTRAENCARARQAKAGIDSGMRLARTNEKGEREVLDDSARAAELRRMQAVIASECS
jgi:hypothetical protein